MAAEREVFRLGVQKCKTTIQEGIRDSGVFKMEEGTDMLFTFLRKADQVKSSEVAKYQYIKKGEKFSGMAQLMRLMRETKKAERMRREIQEKIEAAIPKPGLCVLSDATT